MSNPQSPPDETFRKEIDARVGRTLCQRYTLEEVLGIGATGAVYRGAHRNGNRVAIKVLHTELAASKELREQFLRDAKVANRVEHPGVVRILDDDVAEDGTAFLVMDLLEGLTLEAMMQRQGGKMSSSELVPLTSQLLDVLAAAHEKGVFHRAIEPANVFITTQSRSVKLLGFGTAALAEGTRLPARIGRAMEAAAYVAPEQARGETMNVDAQTDVWATGALMFRALSGAFVHQAETPEMARIRAATQPAPPLRSIVPGIEPDVAEIVDRALATKKEERWRSAAAMATALRSGPAARTQSGRPAPYPSAAPPPGPPPVVQHQSGLPPPPPPPGGPIPPMQQAPMPPFDVPSTDNGWIKWVAGAAALMVLLVVGAGLAGVLYFRSHRKAPDIAPLESAAQWSDVDSPVPVTSRDPMWGNRDALVTIVEFSDFQCPFCARVEPTLEQVKSTYGPDKVRVIWKNQPLAFHQNAKPAAEAAQAVFMLRGSTGFFIFHDLAFQNQGQLTAENFHAWALAAGADGKSFDQAVTSHSAAPKIEEDQQVAKAVGANGTPAFRINGVELSGAQPLEKFKQVIDAELAKANAALATGTKREALYVSLSKQNFTNAPKPKSDDDAPEDTKTVWRVPVGGSPIRGNVDAPVTIVEFGDFQCPFCKRVEQTLDKIREHYGAKVRIVWKHEPLPFHPRAEPAAELALEARAQKGDLGFFQAHDRLFDAQPKLDDDDLAKIAAQLGLDAAKVKTAIRDKKHAREIDADVDLADDVEASGTPHFFVNGRRLVGAQPFEKFQTIIDEELRKFDDHDRKIAAKDYYAFLMRDAKGTPEPEKKRAPPVPAGAPFRGGKDARVVIQEWGDFQCPFCLRVEPTLVEVLKLYGDRVKLVWRDKPLAFHPDAALAAELAREALAEKGPDGFWRMHDKLFANQQKLKRDSLDAYAADLRLDMTKVSRALDGKTHQQEIDADDKLGTELGLTGTPAFLINGYVLNGAQPLSKFRKLIERALADVR